MHVHPMPQLWPEMIQPKLPPRTEDADAERLRLVGEKYAEARGDQRDRDRNPSDRQPKRRSEPTTQGETQGVVHTAYGYAAAPAHKIDTFI